MIITTLNLSTNPRMRKEIGTLLHNKYSVFVIAHKLRTPFSAHERFYKESLGDFDLKYVSSDRDSFLSWLVYSVVHYTCKFLLLIRIRPPLFLAIAESKVAVPLLLTVAKKRYNKIDLILCHNLAAMFAGCQLADRINKPLVLDVEDYYPGEQDKILPTAMVSTRSRLLAYSFAKASLITYSSEQIREMCENSGKGAVDGIVIPNTFLKSEFVLGEDVDAPLRMVWFSQNIDFGRGIDVFIEEIFNSEFEIELHLIGNLRSEFASFISDKDFVHAHDILDQPSLHRKLAQFHIGLAVEDKNADTNRDLCLTNKIWAYYLAGHFILYSDTRAQSAFMHDKEFHGRCIDLKDRSEVSDIIEALINHRDDVVNSHRDRFEASRGESWEVVSKTWITNLERVLHNE